MSLNKYFKNLPKPAALLLSAVSGTTAMTLFSYGFSRITKRQNREPEVLAGLLAKAQHRKANKWHTAAGFVLHYLAGYAFSLAFLKAKKVLPLKRTDVKNGMMLGALSSLWGIAIWQVSVKLHDNPPKINYGRYFLHLIPAHMVFGAVEQKTLEYLKKTGNRAT